MIRFHSIDREFDLGRELIVQTAREANDLSGQTPHVSLVWLEHYTHRAIAEWAMAHLSVVIEDTPPPQYAPPQLTPDWDEREAKP